VALHQDAQLSRWTGEFLDANQEQAFQVDAWPGLCRQLRLITVIAGSLYVAMLYLNWKGFGTGLEFRIMVALRLATGVSLWGIALASRPHWPQRRVHVLFLLTILLLVATRLVENHLSIPRLTPGATLPVLVFPVMPLIIFAIIAIPLRLAVVWSGVGALLLLRDQVYAMGIDATVTQLTLLNLVMANGVGYAFRVAWNRFTRRDFALRRALEREVVERQRAEAEARKADAAKGRFLAVLSHEIRTPLNGVLGGVQLLQETSLLPEQRQLLEMLARSGNQLSLLLDDVLDLARIEAERLELSQEAFSPVEVLNGVHAVCYAAALAKGLTLREEYSPELPPLLQGDPLRLRQVLINLTGNAVKFTEQGEVVLAVSITEVPDQSGEYTCAFSVRDTGPGLEAEAQQRIFSPFEQGNMSTQRRHEGVGLGLAISRELVAAMGGELRVESVPGRGSTFAFSLVLPRCEQAATLAPLPAPGRSLSVLVVDDLEANRIVAEGLLKSLGHRPLTVGNGLAALDAIASEPFDAVLLDLHMQDMDGLELLQRIRGLSDPRRAKLPVFLATADLETGRLQACLGLGMQGILPKPVRKAQLAALLAGVTSTEAALVDTCRVAQLRADLGEDVWAAGLAACRASAAACLQEVADPTHQAPALHRLAGLSASYGMPRLHQQVRVMEALTAAGKAWPLDHLRGLVEVSLAELESLR